MLISSEGTTSDLPPPVPPPLIPKIGPKDGNDYISAHSDDEKEISSSGVLSISIGAVRKFRIRDKFTRKIIKDIPTTPYSVINMTGDFQKEFLHEIPIEKKIKDTRISFTFRKHDT